MINNNNQIIRILFRLKKHGNPLFDVRDNTKFSDQQIIK